MLGLVNVGREGDNARDTVGVGLGRSRGGSVHDTVLGVTEEIRGTTQTVEHAGTHDTGAVGVGVDVHLNRSVHGNDTQAADDLRRVGNLLGTEQQLRGVCVPVVVEPLESVGGETDRSSRREVEVTAVEEVQESVLENLRPDLQALEVGITLAQTTHDGIGNVTDTRLEGQQARGETAVVDLVLQELNQVASNALGDLILRGVRQGQIRLVALDNGDDLLRVHGNVRSTNAVLRVHDQVRLAVGRKFTESDIVQTLERRAGGVHLNDDLLRHLDEFWGSSDGGSRNDSTVLGDGRRLNDSNIQLVSWLVLGVPALS